MPLLDHFHAPPEQSVCLGIVPFPMGQLHRRPTERDASSCFFAQVQVRLGTQVEADVAEFESSSGFEEPSAVNGARVLLSRPAPPAATLVLPTVFPDDIEVHVRDEHDDARLVAAVELVSPRNKDRPDSRGFRGQDGCLSSARSRTHHPRRHYQPAVQLSQRANPNTRTRRIVFNGR